MKKIVQLEDSVENKISYYHVLLFLLTLPFDRFYSHLIIISLLIHTLIHFRKDRFKSILTFKQLILQSIFWLTLISAIYSVNRNQGIQEIGKQAFILLMPILFCLNPLDWKKYYPSFFLVFALGGTIGTVYLYFQAVFTISYYQLPLTALFSPAFTNHNFSEPFTIHATYLSMQLSLALIYLIYLVLKGQSKLYTFLLSACCCILTAGIIQLSSKSILVSLVLILNLALPYFLLNSKQRLKYLLVSISASLLLFIGIYKIEALKNRYFTDLKKDFTITGGNELSDPRLARWELAIQIAASKPLFGYGAGTENELLKTKYFEHKLYRSYLAALNAHNEFLSLTIKAGIFGLLVYLGTLYFGFMKSIRRKDLLFFSFIVLITLVSFSENILDVDKGIIFYSFFFSLFYFSGQGTKNSQHILKQGNQSSA